MGLALELNINYFSKLSLEPYLDPSVPKIKTRPANHSAIVNAVPITGLKTARHSIYSTKLFSLCSDAASVPGERPWTSTQTISGGENCYVAVRRNRGGIYSLLEMMIQESLSDGKIFEQKFKEVRDPDMQISGGKSNSRIGDKYLNLQQLWREHWTFMCVDILRRPNKVCDSHILKVPHFLPLLCLHLGCYLFPKT